MTPKEKAYDLVILFTDKHNNVRKDLAKKFALIAVDEILSVMWNKPDDVDYWKQVKQEIEKL